MRLKIEDWLTEQIVPAEASQLLQEAIVCYKASAYRASLLFSYLFFQTTLKFRILNTSLPENIRNSDLRELLDVIGNEDKWDKAVYDITIRKKEPVLFILNDDIRNQLTYWRGRRNDCAHAKSNIIEASHVESFWYFLQSNLPKFYVNGGKSAVMSKVEIHFTRSLTSAQADPTPIIQDIPKAMSERDFSKFLEELQQLLKAYGFGNLEDEQKLKFWQGLFNLQESYLAQYIHFLKDNMKLCRAILKYNPSNVRFFGGDPQFIRSLWYAPGEDTEVRVVIALIRQQLIPPNEIEETIMRLIECQAIVQPDDLSQEELMYLVNNNFVELFRNYAFTQMNIKLFEWGNHHKKKTIIWYLENYGFDEEVVKALYHTFSQENHPWHLKDAIRFLFIQEPRLQEQYKETCEKFGVPIASRLLR